MVSWHDPVPEQGPVQPAKAEPVFATADSCTTVPKLNSSVQVVPQFIPFGLLVTIPIPVPVSATVRVAPPRPKPAATDSAEFISTWQAPVPEQAPVHPVNVEPGSAAAISWTVVPLPKLAWQVGPQFMPPGTLVTIPLPEPVSDSVSWFDCGGRGLPVDCAPQPRRNSNCRRLAAERDSLSRVFMAGRRICVSSSSLGGKANSSRSLNGIRRSASRLQSAPLMSILESQLPRFEAPACMHVRLPFTIAASLGLVSLALVVWAYFSIWGYIWFRLPYEPGPRSATRSSTVYGAVPIKKGSKPLTCIHFGFGKVSVGVKHSTQLRSNPLVRYQRVIHFKPFVLDMVRKR